MVLDALFIVVTYSLVRLIMISGKVLPVTEGVVPAQYYFAALLFIVPVYLLLRRISPVCAETGSGRRLSLLISVRPILSV